MPAVPQRPALDAGRRHPIYAVMVGRLLILLAVVALAGCAGPTPYQPATGGSGGYAEQQIEPDRYRVTFSGNALTPRETVENALLYRAAEITLANHKDYFVVVSEAIEPRTSYRSYYRDFPPTAFGYRRWMWDPSFDTVTVPVTRYDAYAEIVLFSGPKPEGDVRAFDARAVIARLGPTLPRPKDRG